MIKRYPFKYFKTSPEIVRLAVMIYVRFPLSPRIVEDLLHECGIDVSYETVRFWWHRMGPIFAAEIRKKGVQQLRVFSNLQLQLGEVFVKINGVAHYLWREADHEGEVLESYVTKRRGRKTELKSLRKTVKRFGTPHVIAPDDLRSNGAAMKIIGNAEKQETAGFGIGSSLYWPGCPIGELEIAAKDLVAVYDRAVLSERTGLRPAVW